MYRKQGILILFIIGFATIRSMAQEVRSFSLEEAQAYAIENSYKARIAEYNVQESEYQVKETMGIGLPQLNGNIDYMYNIELPVSILPAEFVGGEAGDFVPIQFGTTNSMNVGATLSQLVFDGTYIIGLKGAKVYNDLVRQEQGATDFEIKKNTSDAYYLSVVSVENHKMLLDNLTELEKQLHETEVLYENGLVEEQNVDQLQLNVGKIKIEVDNAARQKIITHNMLKFQLGIALSDSIVLTDDIQMLIDNAAAEIAGRYVFDVSTNVQYQVADKWVEVRNMQVKLEKAKYLPSLSAKLNVMGNSYVENWDYFDGANWFGASYLGVSMSVPIFSGLQRNSSLQRARVNSMITQVQREELEASLNLQLASANANFNQALAAFNISKENVAFARKIRDRTYIKYQEGMATSFELTQSESQLITDQFNLVGAALNLFEAKTQIDQILNN
jgi:outer membrane protein TolC